MSAEESGDTSTMPATNGEPHPDSTVVATPGKRKRSTDEKSVVDATASSSRDKSNLHENLRSLVDLLLKLTHGGGRHDAELQLLSCPFPSSAAKPRAKRAKTSTDQETSNVRTRVESSRYNTLQEFLADIEKASAAVIERNQNQSNGTKLDGTPLTEVVNRIAAFKKHMNSLIGQSFVNQTEVKTETPDDDAEEQADSLLSNVGAREDRQALTFFGANPSNPGNPKQLFSSLQKSVKVSLHSSESDAEKFVEVQGQLREGALPTGIASTKVVPYNLNATKPSKRTFGEVFTPRPGLPPMEPPRRRTHRSSSVSWIDPFDAVFDTKCFLGGNSSYSLATLPAGQWLQYGGVTSSPSYWGRVEKHHAETDFGPKHGDPALWTGDDPSYLQGVFSSFAPSYDSSGAIVQADSKDMIWWGKRGAKRLRTLLSLPSEDEQIPTVQPGSIGDLDESTLDEMVKSFNPDDFAVDIPQDDAKKVDPESREVEEILQEISELLDTLSSYQRIRNLSLPSGGENPESNETAVPDFGTPDDPSDAERMVYETLKSSLFAIINNLPPFAVAKLDGDQLAELNISQKIIVETPDYSGTMERDDYTLHQERAAAIAAAAAPTAANRISTPTSARPGYQQPAQTGYNQRSFTPSSRVSQSQPGIQASQQGRQSSTGGAYNPAYAGGRPSTPGQRPGYIQQQFSQQANAQYSQGNNASQFARPAQNGYTQSPQPYTPRPGQSVGYNATPQGRTPYANATVSTQRMQYAAHTPSQAAYANTAAAASYARSAAEQQAAKAQLAAAQQRQSPSALQPQGFEPRHSSHEGSLTPGKQNGTPVRS
ncbi:hypothetical protein N7462_009470 [Penicillium macrosclerotiorum]|uniref:uncharacterized protein n=1 Tax=Penicillium macrosclerotiorum TaxID=303699 RepID=UPI0025472004|nr:uncharacterized protein N7462_009470 [Penicillium macrosclerotiorum]KAJ5674031.1 hypothetical protein N7462_009470 [Penicillium macrosclerotiorum]